jgi:hypothetical protein
VLDGKSGADTMDGGKATTRTSLTP